LEEILDKCIAVSEMVKNEPQKQELQGIIVLERFISEQTELNENTKKRTVKEMSHRAQVMTLKIILLLRNFQKKHAKVVNSRTDVV